MKKISLLASGFVAALVLCLFQTVSLTAHAEAKNYTVFYSTDYNEWRYQEGSSYDSSKEEHHMYYLLQQLKDGDQVAVYAENETSEPLDLGSVKLGNLTIVKTASTVAVKTGGVSECYVLAGTSVSVSGNVDYAHIYDVASVTFAGNVTELISTAQKDAYDTNIGVTGTVGHYNAYSIEYPRTFWNIYDVDANKLVVEDGTLKTLSYYYSLQPSAATTTVDNSAATTTAPTTTTTTSASEYDDVPKTGEDASYAYLLLLAAAVCGAGSVMLRKRV